MIIQCTFYKIMKGFLIINRHTPAVIIAIAQILGRLSFVMFICHGIVFYCFFVALFAAASGVIQRAQISHSTCIACHNLIEIYRNYEISYATRHNFCLVAIMQIAGKLKWHGVNVALIINTALDCFIAFRLSFFVQLI